jgi:hypothetical protein
LKFCLARSGSSRLARLEVTDSSEGSVVSFLPGTLKAETGIAPLARTPSAETGEAVAPPSTAERCQAIPAGPKLVTGDSKPLNRASLTRSMAT